MHRLLIVRPSEQATDRFRVVADSANPDVSESNSRSIAESGGTDWEEFDDSTGYSSPYATVPCESVVSTLGYWFVNKTGNVLDYDFAAAGLSERKIITSGELHVECDGRRYVGKSGDSMIFLLDPADRAPDKTLRPFPVRFFGDHTCTVVYTEYVLPS